MTKQYLKPQRTRSFRLFVFQIVCLSLLVKIMFKTLQLVNVVQLPTPNWNPPPLHSLRLKAYMEEPTQDDLMTTDLLTVITHPAGDPSLQVTEAFLRKCSFIFWSSFGVSAAVMWMKGSSRQQLADKSPAQLFITPIIRLKVPCTWGWEQWANTCLPETSEMCPKGRATRVYLR